MRQIRVAGASRRNFQFLELSRRSNVSKRKFGKGAGDFTQFETNDEQRLSYWLLFCRYSMVE